MFAKIISGGQTGVDQAGLDFAIQHNIPHGGSIPKGRMTECGPLPDRYIMLEMQTESYPQRTEQNVLDSDGTLIISHGKLTGGSALTLLLVEKYERACLHVDLETMSIQEAGSALVEWARENNVHVLNVAGPRASKDPEIYAATIGILEAAGTLG